MCLGSDGHRVIEVEILVIPLNAQAVLTAVLKSRVNWCQVLASAHAGDPGVGGVVAGLVLLGQANRQPSLLHLGVGVSSRIIVGVDFRQKGN